MLELKTEKLKLKFDGEEIELSYPTLEQVANMQDKIKKEENKELMVMKDFFLSLGMSEKIFSKMQAIHLQYLIEELTGQKKS